MKNNSNITNKPFKLLDTAVGTISVRRELTGKGIADAGEEVTMAPELVNPFADAVEKQEALVGPFRKRKWEPNVESITGDVKKLCVEPDPSVTMNQMEWKEKSGKLYGKWTFAE